MKQRAADRLKADKKESEKAETKIRNAADAMDAEIHAETERKARGKADWREAINRQRVFLIAAILGGIAFLLIYGIHILNPAYTGWLFHGPDGDLTQHYLGWKFFREDSWHFPVGIMENIAWPNRVSIIFTDSIPLLAVFFKLFCFLLPEQFQYFGWWGLLCFILQAFLAAKILKKHLESNAAAVLGSLFFVFAPVLIDRMYWMTSLAAQWLCLLGIWYLEDYERLVQNRKRAVLSWTVLGILCGSIHLYFLPMCGILLCGFCIMDIIRTKKGWTSLFAVAGYLLGAVFTIALLGGFSSNMGAASYGLGDYSFNLNGFFNPTGRFAFWSRILPAQTQYIDNQYEGFAYLGFGVLLLLFVTITQLAGNGKEILKSGRSGQGRGPAYAAVFVLSVLAAASPVITWNERVLTELPIPAFVRTVWEMFRASGRLVWPALYVVLLLAVAGDGRYIKREVKTTVLVGCLLLQIFDMKDTLAVKRAAFQEKPESDNVLTESEWQELSEADGIRHIVFLSDVVPDRKLLYSFGDYATQFGMTVNDFYFARPMGEAVERSRQEALAKAEQDTVFISYRNESQDCLSRVLHHYEIDGLIAGCSKPLSGSRELTRQELATYRFDFSAGQYVNNGEDIDGVRYLHSYGNSYGPYLKAEPGVYHVTITGGNLTNAELQCHYAHGDHPLEIQNLQITADRATYEVYLEERTEDLEFPVWNTGTDDMQLHSMEIVRTIEE